MEFKKESRFGLYNIFAGLILFLLLIASVELWFVFYAGNRYDIGFWIFGGIMILLIIVLLFVFILLLLKRAVISDEGIELLCCTGKYKFAMSEIQYIDLSLFRGSFTVTFYFKSPIRFIKKKGGRGKKSLTCFSFIAVGKKRLQMFKRYVPKDIPWISKDPSLLP